MPFCPNCGTEVGNSKFCPNCGIKQGDAQSSDTNRQSFSPPPQQTVRITSGHQYDEGICLLICCCLSPIGALIYYLLTDHPEKQYRY